MIELYPYQNQTIKEVLRFFSIGIKRVIMALPTGSGKTVVFSEMVKRAAAKGTRVVILTDRIELFGQISRSLERIGVTPEFVNAASKIEPDFTKQVFVCMVETLKRREHLLQKLSPQLIICDECHKSAFTKVLDVFPDTFTIGATATPVGKHIPVLFKGIVQPIDIPDLITQGFLVRCRAYQMQDNFDDLTTKAGEFTDESLMNHFDKKTLYDGVIREFRNKFPVSAPKTICFNVNILHTEKMHQAWLDAGYRSAMITSKTPKSDRENILSGYTAGEYDVLNNCGVLTTGYDEPSIECVIVNRATLSLSLWLQMVGRGGRKFTNKTEFTCLDFGMNHKRHGLWSMPRKWSIDPEKKRKKSDLLDIAPVKTCDQCGAMVPIMAKECEFCLNVFDMANKKLRNGVLVEVLPDTKVGRMLSDMSLSELSELQDRGKPFSAPLVWRVVRSKGEEAIAEYGSLRKYTRGWYMRQLGEIDNCTFRDMEVYPVEDMEEQK